MTPRENNLQIELIDGRFRPLLKLGEGGMGEVLLAAVAGPLGFRKLVVLKCLRAMLASDAEMYDAFMFEARLTARMNHPNVVQVTELVQSEAVPVIVMEYLEGQALSCLFKAAQPLPLELHLHVLCEVLKGLEYVHDLKDDDGTPLELVHRDLSPDNVMITYDGAVKILDFGIAKSAAMKRDHRTRTGVLKGKLRYMAPEQVGGDHVDRRTDLFSVGIMLWEALAGRRLWEDKSEGDQMRALITGDWPSLREVRPGLPNTLYAVVEGVLQDDLDARIKDAATLRELVVKGMAEFNIKADDGSLVQFMRSAFGTEREATHERIMRRVESNEQGWSQVPPAMSRTSASTRRETITRIEARDAAAKAEAKFRRLRLGLLAGGGLAALLLGVGAWMTMRKAPVVLAPVATEDSKTPCATPGLIDDFEDDDGWLCTGYGRGHGQWMLYYDGTGQVFPPPGPITKATRLTAPRGRSNFALEIHGNGMRDYGAGLALPLAGGKSYDVSGFAGVALWIKSTSPLAVDVKLATRDTMASAYGGRCEVAPSADCNDHYSATRTVGAAWTYFRIPIAELKQQGTGQVAAWNPKEVVELAIRIPRPKDAKELNFELFIDDVSFY